VRVFHFEKPVLQLRGRANRRLGLSALQQHLRCLSRASTVDSTATAYACGRPARRSKKTDQGAFGYCSEMHPSATNSTPSQRMDELDAFLRDCIATDERRTEVREACGASLDDLRRCELEDLEEVLPLNTWPPLVRRRFLYAWRALNEDDAVADTDKEEAEEPAVAPPQPPSPAPSPPPPVPDSADDAPRYEVGDQVEARWRGGAKFYAALVLVVRVDGSCDLQYTDGDTESRVDPALLRPLARRRRRAAGPESRAAPGRAPGPRRAPPAPVAEADPSDAESESSASAPVEFEPATLPTATAHDEPASPTDEPDAPAPPPTPVVESEPTLVPPAEQAPSPMEPATEPAEVPTAEPTAPAPPVAEPASAPDSPPAPILTEPEPAEVPMAVEPEPAPAPAVQRTPSPEPVMPMETTAMPPPPHDDDDHVPAADASAMDVDAPARPAALDRTPVDVAEAASVLKSIGADMVRTVDLGTRSNKRPPNIDWRLSHTYSFLLSLRTLGDDLRGALTEALLKGQRGEIPPDVARRAVARIFLRAGGDLRTLEKFQHTLSPQSAPLASEATVSWFDPTTGLDLYAYSSCGAAAAEWGVRAADVRECVEGKVLFVNGLKFRRQTRWPVPAGAERVSRGVFRVAGVPAGAERVSQDVFCVAGDRYRVQLGHDWGFLGNFDSAGAAALVHAAAQKRLTQARRSREAHTTRQLTEGATIDLGGCYILLRSLASGRSFPRGFSVRKHRVPFVPFEEKAHDAYFVSRQRSREIPYGAELVYAQVHPPQRDLTWWDPREPNRGLSAQRLSVRAAALSGYTGYQYRLVKRSAGGAAAVDGDDASLVQLWRCSAVEASPVPAVPPPPADWAMCAQCDKWRVLPVSVSAATLSDAWKCGDIGLSCSKIACSLEDADCVCHFGTEGEVVLLSSNAITATYCSPAGAAAAHGITWQDAQRKCSASTARRYIESAAPPVLRYATAWADEIKRRETLSVAAANRRAAQEAKQKDAAEAASAAKAAMAALARAVEWAQFSSAYEKWRVLPEGISAATLSDAWTCADIGVACSKVACSLAENAAC